MSVRVQHRVVITGMGVMTSLGQSVSTFCEGLRNGRSGFRPAMARTIQGFPVGIAAEVQGFDPEAWVDKLAVKAVSRSGQLAIAAAKQAIADAGIGLERAERCSVSVGTTDGSSQAMDEFAAEVLERGPSGVSVISASRWPADQLSAVVASELGFRGETVTISTACAAGNFAIANAYDLVRSGDSDVVVCGGSESISRKPFAGFHRLGAVAPDVCRPFDADRQGMIPGEGAGMIVLESLEGARARGAKIYAEVLGYGVSCDAMHATAPDRESIVRCIRSALSHSGLNPEDVSYVCAHGTGTAVNDRTESGALNEVFNGSPPPTSSIKSMIGHTMGAASALGAVACALAIQNDFAPPTTNFRKRDPECDLDCIPNEARQMRVRVAQNNGYGFGGNNAVLMLGEVRP